MWRRGTCETDCSSCRSLGEALGHGGCQVGRHLQVHLRVMHRRETLVSCIWLARENRCSMYNRERKVVAGRFVRTKDARCLYVCSEQQKRSRFERLTFLYQCTSRHLTLSLTFLAESRYLLQPHKECDGDARPDWYGDAYGRVMPT